MYKSLIYKNVNIININEIEAMVWCIFPNLKLVGKQLTVVEYEFSLSVPFREIQLHALQKWVFKSMINFYWAKSNFSNISN